MDLQKKRAIIFTKKQIYSLHLKQLLGIGNDRKLKKIYDLYKKGMKKLRNDFDLIYIIR